MEEQHTFRTKKLKNKFRLVDFYGNIGGDLLKNILTTRIQPISLYEKLLQSEYYASLNQEERESFLSIETKKSFSDLELDESFELLKRFAVIEQPECLWCGNCPVQSVNSEKIGENLEIFMCLWKNINNSKFLSDEQYLEYVSILRCIGHNLSKINDLGKSFSEHVENDLADTRPKRFQIFANGKDVVVQIGKNNTTILRLEVFDHTTKNEETGSTCEQTNDIVKMTLHIDPTPKSGLQVASIEERILKSLSGEELQQINNILEKEFGVHIVYSRRGSVIFVVRKVRPISNYLHDTDFLGQFLLHLFKLIGFSEAELSGMFIRVDITTEDLEIFLSPRKTIESMSKVRKGKLVSTILSAVYDKDPWEIDEKLQIKTILTTESTCSQKKNIELEGMGRKKVSRKNPGRNQLFNDILLFIATIFVLIFLLKSLDYSLEIQKNKTTDVKSTKFGNNVWTGDGTLVLRNVSYYSFLWIVHKYRHDRTISHLDITYNKFVVMNFSYLKEIDSLGHINASNNAIQKVSGLEKIPSLRVLDCSNNELTKLTDLHDQLPGTLIKELLLRNNRIFIIQSTDFLSFPVLEYLDVSHNPIKTINIDQIPIFERMVLQDRCCKTDFDGTTILMDCSIPDPNLTLIFGCLAICSSFVALGVLLLYILNRLNYFCTWQTLVPMRIHGRIPTPVKYEYAKGLRRLPMSGMRKNASLKDSKTYVKHYNY